MAPARVFLNQTVAPAEVALPLPPVVDGVVFPPTRGGLVFPPTHGGGASDA
jgi:hypothetical protein